MDILNDRKTATVEMWVDDCGKLRHFALHQNPGNELRLYLDGIEITKSPKVQSLSEYKQRLLNEDDKLRSALINWTQCIERGEQPDLNIAYDALGLL